MDVLRASERAVTQACIRRHLHADGDWLLATRPSAPALAGCLREYVGYEERSRVPVCRLEVPHPNVTVIINLGAPLAVHAPALMRPGATYGSFVAGLFDTVAVTANTGASSGIEMNLTPLGMWQLFGVPMHEFANRIVGFDTLLGSAASELEDRLRSMIEWDARFDYLDAVLSARFAQRSGAPPEVRWALEQLTQLKEAPGVSCIARELQWSRRRLSASFREHVGVTPKMFVRVSRFDRAVRSVREGRFTRWSSLAYDCGYADQSHLTREFREFAGLAPTEFLRRQRPDLVGLSAD
jgi:AraC-like DNA-binding protein